MIGGAKRMSLIFDTHVLVWYLLGDKRLSLRAQNALSNAESKAYVSPVIAWECGDLAERGRFKGIENFAFVMNALDLTILDFPTELWRFASSLPNIHRDPIDRMMIAHALHSDLTIVTSDSKIHQYPVKTLW